MIRLLATLLLAVPLTRAQEAGERPNPDTGNATVEIDIPEEVYWRETIARAGTSAADTTRALEQFLERFPETRKRPEIERTLAQSAIDSGDRRRLLRHGIPVLEREPDHLILLEHVTRALLADDDPERSKQALQYARMLERSLRVLALREPSVGSKKVLFRQRVAGGLGKALVFQSRAVGNLGDMESAVKLALASYVQNPTAEAAREAGRWLSRLGRSTEALRYYADAFTIEDSDNTPSLRAGDRERMKEIYVGGHGSEKGLGDLILEAYDHTTARLERQRAEWTAIDPNFGRTKPLEFVLSGLNGDGFEMSSLEGKVVVLDFWATWCKPCRVQQPLYEKVLERYKDRDDIAFLHINTDTEREVVGPFLEQMEWTKTVHFEDGLQNLLEVRNIPTTIILDRDGEVASRMIGFEPERFVEMLIERIDRTIGE